MANLAAIESKINSISAMIHARNYLHVERDGDALRFAHNGLSYIPEPTGLKLHLDADFVRSVVGPVGSGKSTMCCMEIIRHVMSMPKCKDGIRRARWAVIRNTYPDLKTTTLATWKDWFLGMGNDSLRMDSPITYLSRFNTEDGECELQVLFIALDRDDDVRKLMSLELSGAYINEARYIPKLVLNTLKQRVGRYPNKQMLSGEFESRILLDTNPCDTDFWFYKLFEEQREIGHKVFNQPPGLLKTDKGYITNPEAENLAHLPHDYYVKAANGVTEAEIRVQLMGEYGSFVEGDPVFASYHDDIHSVEGLTFTEGLPVYYGWDYGLTPCIVFAQLSPRGQLQIIKELCSEDMFLERFLDDIVIPFIQSNIADYDFISIGDPAGNIRKDTDGKTCEDILAERGIPTQSAKSNLLTPRLGAIDKLLTRMVDGQPAFVISRDGCPRIRKGFQGKYCYKIVGGKKEPDKNEYSHPMDALQYIAMEIVGIDKPDKASAPASKRLPDGWC